MTDLQALDVAISQFNAMYYSLADDATRDIALQVKYGLEHIKDKIIKG